MICIPITSSSTKQATKDILLANKLADLVELRLDLIKSPDLKKLLVATKKPVIVTNRKKGEGGHARDNKQRIELLKKAITLNADFIDIELNSGKKIIRDLIKNKRNSKVIVSYHNFKKTPQNINRIYKQIKKLNPDIIKLATFANSITDNLKIFEIIKKAKKENKKIIALCMGQNGEISRILAPLFGSYLTFAALKQGKGSAPGQLTASTLKDIYRIHKLHRPKIFGLVGNPVDHSKGYIIHNRAFNKLRLNNIYLNFLVGDIGKFIKAFKPLISGLSITIPHKKSVMKHLDNIDPLARNIGAANTIIKKDNKLIGYNTDCTGAIKALKQKSAIRNKNTAIIGAGGVARAIAFGIKQEKGDIIIINRTESKAKKLASELSCSWGGLSKLNSLQNIDILVNCTSIGMHPDIDRTPVKKQLLKRIMSKKATVFDTVYTPPLTKLLKDASSLNLKTVSGQQMFINQAKEQFRLFTSKEMPK